MTKTKTSRRLAWRKSKIEADRLARENKQQQQIDNRIGTSELGPEQQGRIVSHFGANFSVQDAQGNLHLCLSRRNLPKLVCGDYVTWQSTGELEGVIVALVPRRTLLARPGYHKQLKPIAANIDQILVVIAPQPSLDEDLINRYLVAATLTGITPVIVLNKVDLLNAKELASIQRRLQVYSQLGYEVIHASTHQKQGLKELLNKLENTTSIFVGQSGVGKSSLIKVISPESAVRIGELSHATGLGKHTTTVSTLYRLPHNGAIIDSPGIREFGLGQFEAAQIAQGFVEFQSLIAQCKFNDCHHFGEPGCAVRQAVASGVVQKSRYDSYLRIVQAAHRR
ncbi:small ribosomal subunit biogenesis GTPase RsgA [Kaarinaea lacus]